jgi:hypothetical protein
MGMAYIARSDKTKMLKSGVRHFINYVEERETEKV